MQVLNLAVKNVEVSYRVYADAHVSISMQTACSSIVIFTLLGIKLFVHTYALLQRCMKQLAHTSACDLTTA